MKIKAFQGTTTINVSTLYVNDDFWIDSVQMGTYYIGIGEIKKNIYFNRKNNTLIITSLNFDNSGYEIIQKQEIEK